MSLCPSKQTVIDSPVPATTASTSAEGASQFELESACIDLLCKLEFAVSKIKECDPVDVNDEALENTKSMRDSMSNFSESFFTGNALEKTRQEIDQTAAAADLFKTIATDNSIRGLLRVTFGGTDPNAEVISESRRELFQSMKRTIVTLLFHAIQLVGFDSSLGKQLDESTLLFVAELESLSQAPA